MSLISLCLMEGNLPFGQDRICSMVKLLPQAQVVATLSLVESAGGGWGANIMLA